jgi:hypothetical protein
MVTERKLESLSYSSFSDLSEYFQDKFHLPLASEGEWGVLIDAIETRNISVRNRFIINQRYSSRVGVDPSRLGKVRQLVSEAVEDAARTMPHSVLRADKETRKRIGVAGHRSIAPAAGDIRRQRRIVRRGRETASSNMKSTRLPTTAVKEG